MTIAADLLRIFGGNPYHARAIQGDKGIWYDLVEGPLDEKLLEQHLAGEVVLGSYPILQEGEVVRWLGWDVDSSDLTQAREMADQILGRIAHLPYAVEFSGSKGYHIFLFLTEPMPAARAKEISEFVREQCGLARSGEHHVECYPKQSHLGNSTEKRKAVGNLIKLPLGLHPKTHNRSRFVDPGNGWENGPDLSPEECLSFRITPDEAIDLKEEGQNQMEELAKVIAAEWEEGKRHDLSLYLAGYLHQIGWSFDKAQTLFTRICEIRVDDPEPDNRIQSLRDTYRKANRGQTVAGYHRLTEILMGATMQFVTDVAPGLAAPGIARRIDQIRFDKGAGWDKERRIMQLIWSWMTDRQDGGRILRTKVRNSDSHWRTFWYNKQKKRVIPMSEREFETTLFEYFHLNIAEGFVKRVLELLKLKSEVAGDVVQVYRRSAYLGGKLYVNLGGPEIYVMDGVNPPATLYNGENEVFFVNVGEGIIPDFDHPVNAWEELVDDINFTATEETPMPPEVQREMLKAWIIAFFFRNSMPTRPILSFLGDPGSGKTTAIRQVLRFIEGLNSNVADLAEDKPDAWRTMLEHNNMIVLDNLEESNARWLARSLDLVATGSTIELRELYTTNRSYSIEADVFVALTAVSMPFSKSTLFERMLVLHMEKLQTFTPLHLIEERLKNKIRGMWAFMFGELNKAVAALERNAHANIAVNIRLADFAAFCYRLEGSDLVDHESLKQSLKYLQASQQVALSTSENSAFPLIQEWIEMAPEEAAKEMTSGELYKVLSSLASARRRNFYWKNSNALANHLKAMQGVLEQQLGMVIETRRDTSKGRDRLYFSFPGLWGALREAKNGRGD